MALRSAEGWLPGGAAGQPSFLGITHGHLLTSTTCSKKKNRDEVRSGFLFLKSFSVCLTNWACGALTTQNIPSAPKQSNIILFFTFNSFPVSNKCPLHKILPFNYQEYSAISAGIGTSLWQLHSREIDIHTAIYS